MNTVSTQKADHGWISGLDLLKVDDSSLTPKYLQVVEIILSDIKNGIFKIGEQIPSISETSCEFYMARNTVEKAYKLLRKRGIITSIKGKGYYVCGTSDICTRRILFLLNNYSNDKKQIYNAFLHQLDQNTEVDLYIYNGKAEVLEKCIINNLGHYDNFVLLPHIENSTQGLLGAIGLIPRDKLIFLQKNLLTDDDAVSGILQDGKANIYSALKSIQSKLKKYKNLRLIFPEKNYHEDIKSGFKCFCQDHQFKYEMLAKANGINVAKGQVYLVLDEDEMASIIKKCDRKGLVLGKDVGLISYNDSPVKEILKGGITIFTPDYSNMGVTLANYILNQQEGITENPFKVIQRSTL